MSLIIGSHVSYKNDTGLLGSVEEALGYGANTFMFYTGAPQNTRRGSIDKEITEKAVAWSTALCTPEEIDELNILQATYNAMKMAIHQLNPQPDLLLNDAVKIPGVDVKQVPIIRGDASSISIGAASIVAKVTRDAMMVEYDKIYPGYDFASNKGYGSAKHIEAIKKLGPTPIHRKTFIKNFI